MYKLEPVSYQIGHLYQGYTRTYCKVVLDSSVGSALSVMWLGDVTVAVRIQVRRYIIIYLKSFS